MAGAAEEWAERIRAARIAAGMTQAQLADAIGTSRVVVTMYETSCRKPSREAWDAIQAATGFQP